MKIHALLENTEIDLARKKLWINEAKFGFRYINQYCRQVPENANILEVGCGSGILLHILKEEHPDCALEGIEPFESGFASLEDVANLTGSADIPIHNIGYEALKPEKCYDLIYCVNVLEHLPDWRHFLTTIDRWLKPNGKCVILCPNYGFPYEAHFRVPVVGNKALTYRIFRSRIERHEKQDDWEGLWQSLNFVKKSKVREHIERNTELEMIDHGEIIEEMIERVSTDSEFRKRQIVVGRIAQFLSMVKIIKLLRFVPDFIPYMHLELRKR